jgi:hypothetical protein
MARWKWALLIFELVLFAIILILPQVELPEFTLHSGTAPIAAKARLSSNPAQSVAIKHVAITFSGCLLEKTADILIVATPSHSESYLSLICTLLC